ncbi:hypothetical protein DSO57_1016779 [Entomophthora muscae]|uniref:Uncharacterized protein n=1 Tax=Entomophthora muscae TaxID=34485 RepID=A0ACC2U3C4_9FUNG|nr:hypothetical protein DSO57_1016779 [Entomophthora muscae]
MRLFLFFAAATAASTIDSVLSSLQPEDGGFIVVDPQDWASGRGISNCESGLCLLDKSSVGLQSGKIYVDIDYSGTFHDRTLASYRSPRHGDDGYDYNYDYDMYLKDYGEKKAYNGINVHVPKDANLDALNRTITRLDHPPASS